MKHNKQHKFKEQRKNISWEKSERTSKNNNKPTTLANREDQWLKLWQLINLMILANGQLDFMGRWG